MVSTFWGRWQANAVEEASSEVPSMGEVVTIGLDLAKNVFQFIGLLRMERSWSVGSFALNIRS